MFAGAPVRSLYSRQVSVTAIIPLKALPEAKGRFAGALGARDRRALTEWMARRVIGACRRCEHITDVVVVAGDDAGAALAYAAGAQAMVVAEPGLGHALGEADRVVDADVSVVVAADLAAVRSEDLTAVITAAGDQGPVVVVAPTHDGGTGALLRRPPTIIATSYGPGSAARHAQLAADAGARVVLVHAARLALDVDTPEQLRDALALDAESDVGCAPH